MNLTIDILYKSGALLCFLGAIYSIGRNLRPFTQRRWTIFQNSLRSVLLYIATKSGLEARYEVTNSHTWTPEPEIRSCELDKEKIHKLGARVLASCKSIESSDGDNDNLFLLREIVQLLKQLNVDGGINENTTDNQARYTIGIPHDNIVDRPELQAVVSFLAIEGILVVNNDLKAYQLNTSNIDALNMVIYIYRNYSLSNTDNVSSFYSKIIEYRQMISDSAPS